MARVDERDIGLRFPEFLDGLVWRPELQSLVSLGEVVGDHPVAEMPPQSLDRGVVEGIYGRLLDRP